jgi:hypothetical protein
MSKATRIIARERRLRRGRTVRSRRWQRVALILRAQAS